jgi:hypothetical protein
MVGQLWLLLERPVVRALGPEVKTKSKLSLKHQQFIRSIAEYTFKVSLLDPQTKLSHLAGSSKSRQS